MKRTALLIGIPFVAALIGSYIISQKGCEYVMANHPDKPVAFNHKSHLMKWFPANGLSKDNCEVCHGFYENGRFKGLPTIAECTSCHDPEALKQATTPDAPMRKPELARYKPTDRPWGSYAKQPDLVYFSHKVVMTARFEDGRLKQRCASCHGDKANSTNTAMLKGKMLMSQCEDCHSALHISNTCAVCHD